MEVIKILINRKTDYALRALVYLANKQTEWTSVKEISDKMKIPEIFLAKIIQILAKNKIVESQRGKLGGVKLKNIDFSILEIIKLMDKDFYLNKCLDLDYSCEIKTACPIHKIIADLQTEFFKRLDLVKISDLNK